MLAPWRFRFRWIPFVATVLLVLLGIALGNWQRGRAAEKTALQDRLVAAAKAPALVLEGQPLESAAAAYRRVRVSGQFLGGWPLYLDNRPYDGRAGFVLLMPFRIAGTQTHVLVERGWLPRNPQQRTLLPAYATPPGTVTIEGIALEHPGRVMQLGEPAPLAPGAFVQNLDPAGFARASGLHALPFVIEQRGVVDAGAEGAFLVRDWPAPSLGVDKHRGYAFQWYALALTAFLFFLWTGFRRQ